MGHLKPFVLGLFLLCGMVVPVLSVSAQTEQLTSAIDKIIIAIPSQKIGQSSSDYTSILSRYFRVEIENLVAIYGEGVRTQIIQDLFDTGFISTEIIQDFVKIGIISAKFANTLSDKNEFTQNDVAQYDSSGSGINAYSNQQLVYISEHGETTEETPASISR